MKASMSVAVVAGVLLTGCSGEGIAEKAIENQIESESGEDVDVDLDNGNFSIQTEDGEFSVQSDGDQTIIQTEDGDVVMQSEDGQTIIQSDDGTLIGSASGDLPDDFPGDLPLPDGAVFEYTQQMTTPEGQTFILGGSVPGSHGDVLDAYVAALEAAGFTQQQLTTTPDGGYYAYDNGTWTIGGTASEGDDGMTALAITVTPSSGG